MSEPSKHSKHVRHPKLATPARYLFAVFLVATGLMTMMFGVQGYPLPEDPSPFRDFMKAMADTGYIIFWVGLIKFVAGSLLFVRRTTPLALLIALPYTVNILLTASSSPTSTFCWAFPAFFATRFSSTPGSTGTKAALKVDAKRGSNHAAESSTPSSSVATTTQSTPVLKTQSNPRTQLNRTDYVQKRSNPIAVGTTENTKFTERTA